MENWCVLWRLMRSCIIMGSCGDFREVVEGCENMFGVVESFKESHKLVVFERNK